MKKCFFGCVFLLVLPATLFFFSSCGFLMMGSGGFDIASSVTGPGDGATPKLAPRIAENPKLADKDCSESDRCQETCRDLYEEQDSQKACDKLTVGEVSARETVHFALLDADTEELEDIEADDLKAFVKTGLDGWKEVIGKQKEFLEDKRGGNEAPDAYAVFERTLTWMVEQDSDIIPILRSYDRENSILEDLVLNYCDLDDTSHKCQNTKSKHFVNRATDYKNYSGSDNQNFPTPNHDTYGEQCFANVHTTNSYDNMGTKYHPNPEFSDENIPSFTTGQFVTVRADSRKFEYPDLANADHRNGLIMSYSNEGLYYCYFDPSIEEPVSSSPPPTTTLKHKKLARVTGKNRELFLSLVGVMEVFFHKADDKPDAFSWGNDLLEKACADSSESSRDQCLAVFYCFLTGHTDTDFTSINNSLSDEDGDMVEKIGRDIKLKGCNYKDSFTGL